MPQVGEFLDAEQALQVYDHPVVREEVDDLTEVCFVLLFTQAGDKDVVQIGEDDGDAMKNAVHQPLECLGDVLKPEVHAEELPESKGSDDSHLRDVCLCDRNLVVATNQIYMYLAKYLLVC